MTDEIKDLLRKREFVIDSLLTYGFICVDGTYFYTSTLIPEEFIVNVYINNYEFDSWVIDLNNNEEYSLVNLSNAN